jgi:hypothetical protein
MRRCGETEVEGRVEERGRRRRRLSERFKGWRVDHEMSLDVFMYCI